MYKRGRMTRAECAFVRDNRHARPAADLAADLNRSPAMVANELARMDAELADLAAPPPPADAPPAGPAAEAYRYGRKPKPPVDESPARARFRSDLKAGVGWVRLLKELEPDEAQLFADRYVALMEQFEDDVLATEDAQIFKAIKYEILMGRSLAKQRKLNRDLAAVERDQADAARDVLKARLAADKDRLAAARELAELLDHRAQAASAHHKSLTAEYVSLDEKHQKLLQDLKGTRQQRIDKISSGKVSFLETVKDLQAEEVRDRVGRQNEQMKRAAAKELARLSAPHAYADGEEDQPVLNADTVLPL